ncbi:Protein FAR1-RELATED SEQUENCE 5 [Linum perenne]
MLIGVNHHHQSVIFGGAFLENEKSETYIWLLQTFLQCMGGKKPVSVITDGDKAMRHAIGQVFPEAAHRLCSWHIDRNAGAFKLGTEFMRDLNGFMKNRMSICEFEEQWKNLVEKTDLDTHPWVQGLYDDRHVWCEAYLKDKFFAGMMTTLRCEGMSSTTKRYVRKQYNLFEFIKKYERMVDKLRLNETKADFKRLIVGWCAHTDYNSMRSKLRSCIHQLCFRFSEKK